MASGNGGQIAFARIGSLFRDVNTVNIWGSFKSETLEHVLSKLEEGSITGRRSTPQSHKGVDHGMGEIVMDPNPNALTYLVKGFMGDSTSSLFCDATSTGANSGTSAGLAVYWHRFTESNSAFSDRTFLPPHNVMVYRDVGSAWLFKGAIFPSLKLEINAGQLAAATLGVMARQVDRIDRTTAIFSLVSGGGRPWVWDMTSVEVGTSAASASLAASTKFEQLSLTFTLPHEGISLLDGTKKYGEFAPNEFRRIAIEGTQSFRDHAEYDAFIAYEARRMRITLLNVNSALAFGNPASLDATAFAGYFGMRIHLPAVKYEKWSPPISGPNRITASFTAFAEFDETAASQAVIEMMNLVGSTALNAVY